MLMRRRKLSKITLFVTLIVGFFDVTVAVLGAGQARRFAVPRNSEPVPPSADPIVSLKRTQSFEFTGEVDSNSPVLRTIVDGEPTVVVFTSWGGTPSGASAPPPDALPPATPVSISGPPAGGIWIEAVIAADDGTWYGFYHNERLRCAS